VARERSVTDQGVAGKTACGQNHGVRYIGLHVRTDAFCPALRREFYSGGHSIRPQQASTRYEFCRTELHFAQIRLFTDCA